jgi:hypothetical protein
MFARSYSFGGEPWMQRSVRVGLLLRERGAPLSQVIAGIHGFHLSPKDYRDTSLWTEKEALDLVNLVDEFDGSWHSKESEDATAILADMFSANVGEIFVADRIETLKLTGVPSKKWAQFVGDVESNLVPALRHLGHDAWAEELILAVNGQFPPVDVENMLQTFACGDFRSFADAVGNRAESLEIPAPEAALIHQNLEKVISILEQEKVPELKDLLAGLFGINLRGVWVWAEYLSKSGSRTESIRSAISARHDESVLRQDGKTGGVIDVMLADAIRDPETTKVSWIARTIRRIKERR